MYDESGRSPWMRALPVAGIDGSLDGRMKGTAAENNVRAKTGTMSNIRSLAGYVTTADGEHLALVIMLNDFEGAGACRAAGDRRHRGAPGNVQALTSGLALGRP